MRAFSLGVYEGDFPGNLDWKEKLSVAREMGFDFFEINIDETRKSLKRLDMNAGEKDYLQLCVKKNGIPLKTMHLDIFRKYSLGSRNRAASEKALYLLEKGVRLASELGIPIIRLSGYDVYYEITADETRPRFEKNIRAAALIAAKYGVMLGLETSENERLDTVEKTVSVVRKSCSAYMGVYLNSGNITVSSGRYNLNIKKDIRTGEGNIIAAHLKDSIPGICRGVRFGTGSVDFNTFIEQSWKAGVRRFVLEGGNEKNDTWEKTLISGRERIINCLR